jgi:hypothetical protein
MSAFQMNLNSLSSTELAIFTPSRYVVGTLRTDPGHNTARI